MDSHPPMELNRRFAPAQPQERIVAQPADRVLDLSSWMMVLGTVRVICMLTDIVSAFADAVRVEPFTMRTISRVAQEIHPVVAISSVWPLFLAIALRRTRWLQLVPAAAATFLVLSVGGLFRTLRAVGERGGYGGMVGAIDLTRRAFLHPNASDLVLGGLGAIQLGLEFITAIRAIVLIPRLRTARREVETKTAARRARCGRMAFYTSLGYLFVVIRLPVWSTYIEVLNNSTFVRNLVLSSDNERLAGRRLGLGYVREPTAQEKRYNSFRHMITLSMEDTGRGRFADARDRYREIIESVDSLDEDALSAKGRQELLAMALNNLAWLEATCSDSSFWSPRDSVAHCAVLNGGPTRGRDVLEHTGAALYRAGQWDEAKATFEQSMTLRRGGDSFDWFFLAVTELKLGRAAEARVWYDRAVEAFRQRAPQNEELYRFQVEAALALGLPKPDAPAISKAGAGMPSMQFSPIRRPGRRGRAEPEPKTQ